MSMVRRTFLVDAGIDEKSVVPCSRLIPARWVGLSLPCTLFGGSMVRTYHADPPKNEQLCEKPICGTLIYAGRY